MTLDEIEEFAKATRSSDPNHQELILARAVLALLPVVRAAEAWRDRGPGQSHCDEEGCPCTSAQCRLKQAIDTMRAALGGGDA